MQGYEEGLDAAVQGDTQDEENVEPVDMLVPVVAIDLGVGNMDLLGGISGLGAHISRFGRHSGGYRERSQR